RGKQKMTTRVLPYLWYPLFLGSAIAAFGAMLAAGSSPAWAAFAVTFVAAVAIVALEQFFPERQEWRPNWTDINTDAAFMTIVQVALPRILVAFGVIEAS